VGLLGPCGAFTVTCRRLTFPLSPVGTAESESVPPDLLIVVTLLVDGDATLTYEPEDFCFIRPVRAGRALARERLRSFQEPASLHPQAVHAETFRNPHERVPFRLLPIRAPRQAVLRTSFWLAPSRFTNRPCDLPVEKTRDASDRYLPPKRTACTRTSRVPSSSRNFRCADTPRRLRLRAVVLGDRTFHDVRGPLRRIVIGTSPTSKRWLRVVSVGVLFPRYRWRSNL